MLSSLILKRNKKVTNWIWTGISFEENKPFHTKLKPTISNCPWERNLKILQLCFSVIKFLFI